VALLLPARVLYVPPVGEPVDLGEWTSGSPAPLVAGLTGAADRLRRYALAVLAGEPEWVPDDVVSKFRLLESALPILARLMRLRGVSSLTDLLPETDDEAYALLHALHAWTGELLEPETPAAPGGTPGAVAETLPPAGQLL